MGRVLLPRRSAGASCARSLLSLQTGAPRSGCDALTRADCMPASTPPRQTGVPDVPRTPSAHRAPLTHVISSSLLMWRSNGASWAGHTACWNPARPGLQLAQARVSQRAIRLARASAPSLQQQSPSGEAWVHTGADRLPAISGPARAEHGAAVGRPGPLPRHCHQRSWRGHAPPASLPAACGPCMRCTCIPYSLAMCGVAPHQHRRGNPPMICKRAMCAQAAAWWAACSWAGCGLACSRRWAWRATPCACSSSAT